MVIALMIAICVLLIVAFICVLFAFNLGKDAAHEHALEIIENLRNTFKDMYDAALSQSDKKEKHLRDIIAAKDVIIKAKNRIINIGKDKIDELQEALDESIAENVTLTVEGEEVQEEITVPVGFTKETNVVSIDARSTAANTALSLYDQLQKARSVVERNKHKIPNTVFTEIINNLDTTDATKIE